MSTPVPAPRLGGELKKPIPAPRTKIMLSSQKSDDSSSSKSSEENTKTLSRTARRVRSFSHASKQIAGDIGGIVQNKLESTRQSVRRLTRTFSISSHPEENEPENSSTEDKTDGNLDIFKSIKFDSPIATPKPPEYTNWELPRKKAEEVLSEHLFNLPPPSYPPPSLPDDSLYNEPPAVPSPVATVSRRVLQRAPSNSEIYESVYPLKAGEEEKNEQDNTSVTTEYTSLTIESNSELSRSSSWKFYDSVGNVKGDNVKNVILAPVKVGEPSSTRDTDLNSNFSVEVRNSVYENFIPTPYTPPRPSQSVIFQFDPLLNADKANSANTTKKEDYKMLEDILQDDLYGNISAHRTIDTWSLSDSEAEEFVNPPSPPVRFDSLMEESAAPNIKDEKIRPAPMPPPANNNVKSNAAERKSWLKHVKDVVIASSDIIKGKHKEGLVQRPMVHMKNSAYKKGMLYKVQNGPVEDLFGEYSGRWCILENGNLICYSNNTCETVKEHFPIDAILSIESVKHPKLKLKSDSYELNCFKINASGKIRGSHIYGSRNASDRRLWMQTIAESLTMRFGTKMTTDFIRMGWTYVREGVTGKWMGAWLILANRSLQFAVDGQPVKSLDLRKARCIALQSYEETDQNPQTSEKGPNMLVDACGTVVYMRMWTTRETKIWCHVIRVAAHSNGAGIEEQQLTKNDVPVIVEKCINFIYLNGSMTKGIYRQSGVGSLVSDLLTKFAEDAWAVQITSDKFSEHDVATALKRFFRDLPEPLMGISQRQYFYQVSLVKNQDDQIRMYKAALDNLPAIAYKTTRKLLGHLHFIGTQHSKNFMNVINLAAIWGPTLMHFKTDNGIPQPTGAHQQDIMVVADLISLYKHIFPEDALEMEQEKVMLQVLEKHIQSPQGAVTKNAGDFRLWIYLGDKDGQTFNVSIGPNKTALEVCNELSPKVNLQVYEMILEEVVLDGQLTRPIHHSEKILEIVLKWGYWDDVDRKNNYIVINNLSKYTDYLEAKTLLISGEMKFADAKTKSYKNLTFDFSNGRLSSFKDKTCDIKISSWNIEDISWYWGHETKRNPQTKWTITFILKNEVPKRTKNQPFFGNIVIWGDSESRANWLSIMLKTLYPDGITQPLHVNLSS